MTQAQHPAAPALVAVLGATGRSGKLIVQGLLESGFSVRALVRTEAKGREQFSDSVEYAEVDVREPETLVKALAGTDYVISALGANDFTDPNNQPEMVDFQGVANLTAAAATNGVKHLVLVSALGVTNPDHFLNRFGGVCTFKLKGEDVLRASAVPYTIVRPGGLTDEPAGEAPIISLQGDKLEQGTVSRNDLAAVCIAALANPQVVGTTFELVADESAEKVEVAALFANLSKD
jgi:uncharacterized protein YbjT (DUF2867 family)